MSQTANYDEVLSSILVNEKSILGFLSAVFGFLARRTDFYFVPEGQYQNMGFPPGVAEELVIKVLRSCDPNVKKAPNGARKPVDINNEIMCSTVAQEVEIEAEEDEYYEEESAGAERDHQYAAPPPDTSIETTSTDKNPPILNESSISDKPEETPENTLQTIPSDYKPPMLPTQKNNETYNGAERETYSWSQNIMEIDVTMKLPADVQSARDLKVTINSGDVSVAKKNGEVIIKDALPWKIVVSDSFWSISEGKLLMHLEKHKERWWNRFLDTEEPIDLDRIDCSRPLDELPQDHIDKVRELQWNQERKLKGLPTSDEIRNIEILRKAWNKPGSPFQGQEFDPSVLSKNTLNFPEQ